MGIVNQDIRYRLLGQDVSAGRTFQGVSRDISGARSALSSLGNTLGTVGSGFGPLENAMSAVSLGFGHISENGKSAAVTLQGVGIGVASAGAALLAFGANAQQAHAQLDQTFTNAGFAISNYSGQIDSVTSKMASFGHTAGDTDTALAKLLTATQDPVRALQLMSTAADISAQKNLSLTDSSQLLVNALAGNTRAFRQFGLNLGQGKLTADELNAALAELEQRIGGSAQAKADTFSGKIKGYVTEFENWAESLTKFSPELLAVGSALTIVGSAMEIYTARQARRALADTAAAGAQERLAAAQGTNAATAGVASAAQGRLAASEGAAAAAAGAEATALGAVDVAGGAGAVIGAGMAANLGTGGLLTRGIFALGAPAALTGSTVLGGLAAGAAGYIGTTELLNNTGLGNLDRHYLGHDVFRRPDAVSPTAQLGTATQAYLNAHNLTADEFLARTREGTMHTASLSVSDQQALTTAVASYFGGLTPFVKSGPTGGDQAKQHNQLRDDRQKLHDAIAALSAARGGPTTKVDPAAVASAQASVASAQAALTKARYVGGPGVVAATDQLTAAEARLAKAQQGSTSAAHSVADAEMKVRDARQKLTSDTQTYQQTAALSPGQLFKNLLGNVHEQNQIAADTRVLLSKGLDPTALSQVLDINKTHPGTLAAAASGMSRSYIDHLNSEFSRLHVDAMVIEKALSNSAAVRAAATSAAETWLHAVTTRLAGPLPGVPRVGMSRSPNLGQTEFHVHTMNVHANDPKKLARETANHSRLRALGGSGP